MNNSQLYNEETFYQAFLQDLRNCKKELIIESPYITIDRACLFLPYFGQLLQNKVRITIVTKNPIELNPAMAKQTRKTVEQFKRIGIRVYYCGNHHRKLAIIDRKVLYEGSLNILSYTYSSELMRRIAGEAFATEMINFTNLHTII